MTSTTRLFEKFYNPEPGALEAAALDEEIAKLELRIVRAWQALGILGLGISVATWLYVDAPLGIWSGVALFAYLCWFTSYGALLARSRVGPVLRMVDVIVEGTIPWVFLLVQVYARSAAFALGSWLAPLAYAALMVSAAARLSPVAPVVLGIVSGTVFPLLYFVLLRPRLPPELMHIPNFTPAMQLSKGAGLMLGGIVCGVVARGLRNAFGRAQRTVRAQDLFGKYRIGRRIASGGMGVVYEATYCPEGGFARPVAIKRIHAHLAQAPAFVDAFRAEAELSARLVHPNIVQVFDFGRVDDSYFLAMEYVDGLTLAELMRRARAGSLVVPSKVLSHIAREILSGLDYAHARARDANGQLLRVVHRDLSPANVLLSRHGEVKIGDFGVAKVLRDAVVSETRTVKGHLGYMAPEQAGAQPLDERCDLFAVGVIVWELLSGERLFLRDGEAPTIMALMMAPVPPPTSFRPELDAGWDEIIERALERPASRRYASAELMIADLAALPESHEAGAAEDLTALVERVLAMPVPPGRAEAPAQSPGASPGADEVVTRVIKRADRE
jgi:eukaryotic-like serine/threonine-protein kinase